ncbi:MAG TPA: hypothetical protein VJB96_01120 [Patescibacteria group bacterium]|uniref:Uncharacterized protein n=1 Tax=Candidatus Gottesmanbacteria bacterium GW2011_GWA1_47_8 TaxID=1618438 RepID=A0A0G1TGR2_9BACT|nr:MAG: hypothetical protein UY08_C0004G0015 [Candidatus Gottesmanbacteria bacterium GW2011_GWA1_47_8]HLD24494.1 hypothetical protein [Patescibacteria group bacterium]
MVAPEDVSLIDELLGEEEEMPPHLAAFATLREALLAIPSEERKERAKQILAEFAKMHVIAEEMRIQKS